MTIKLKVAFAAAAVTLLLAACGGDSSGDNGGAGGGGSTDNGPSASAKSVYDYIIKLMADNGENSPPVDIDGVTLAVDDNSPPVEFTP